MTDEKKDYQVGYGRPPKQHQFKKGASGNPNGRPKGSKNVAQIVEQVCREEVTVKGENGQKFRIPKMQAVMMQLMNQALRGELRATQTCFRILKMFPHVIEPPPPAPTKRVIRFVKSEYDRLKELAAGIKRDEDGPEVEIPFDEWQELKKHDS